MRIAVAHRLSESDARARVRECVDKLKEQHSDKVSSARVNWDVDPAAIVLALRVPRLLRMSGILDISALLRVSQSEVVIEGALPFGAGVLQGQIEAVIREQLEKCLG